MSVKRRSAQRRDGRCSSFGNTAQPTGTATSSVDVARDPRAHVADALPVQARRARAGAREPVQHQVVQQPVARDDRLEVAVVVRPAPELLHDPGGERGRRVGERVADRLRPRALLDRVARVPLRAVPERVERGLLALGQVAERRGVGRRERRAEVEARDPVRVLLAEAGADRGAPVAARRAEALVPELGHQVRPGVGDPLHAPAGLRGLVAEPVAGQRGTDDVERVGRVGRVRERAEDARGTRRSIPASRG